MHPQHRLSTSTNSTTAGPTGRSLRIVIPGGSGQVGMVLARAFRADGHQVTILSRAGRLAGATVAWDGAALGPWVDCVDGADVVINLAGHSVNCRYGIANRERIMNSRVSSTRVIGEAIRQAARPPGVWLQASTATIYAHRFDAPNNETHGVIGGSECDVPASWGFSIKVAKAWERAVDLADLPHTRKIKMRSAMIMSPQPGGIFDVLLGLVRRGLGGAAGNGRQFVSWIHHQDFVQAVYRLIACDDLEGAINIASPCPLPQAQFMRALREAWGTRVGLPAPAWLLAIGTLCLRTESELILKSRRVFPGVLAEHGFAFRFPEWSAAAEDLCNTWRQARPPSFFERIFLL